ncbi:levanase [Microbacterium sp. ru370.1]|uniref:glycoside hydrolase family 32 protein n=1 Tax=unclassified Microbacterium TaxID=2609290 RepID=UPI0008855C04|nr:MULTISPECIES: glycoside hydrolase family 32 protein [unclassified Microbacterium]SDO98972.1 levanase [Microbacterium sp. ru370.1]SIT92505.1 levanase/fructan beta-fructosidase [Microbacterium sp. RU1D]
MTTEISPASVVPTTRPVVHFAPQRNWMNDPNGLVFHDGVYHLFFQYNPHGTQWGNMSWGHATSIDLVTWTEHPVALLFDDDAQIFSGSVVCDEDNSSGLGEAGRAPLVALYTAAAPDGQAQALAWSSDGGATWTKHGVVLDRGTADFRDPKVLRVDDHWVMITVEAVDRQMHLFRSRDLLHWHPLSVFGPQGPTDGIWECPDLFRVGDEWVITLSVNPGHPAGGSGMLAFIGDFDGVTFTADRWQWLDHGPDYYAGVTFSGLDERVMIAWLNNWAYAHDLPDAPWRGSMALPRTIGLREGRVVQTPAVAPLEIIRFEATDIDVPSTGEVIPSHAVATAARLRLRIGAGSGRVTLRWATAAAEGTTVVELTHTGDELLLERHDMAGGAKNTAFPSSARATLPPDAPGARDLDVWIDANSIEVFAAGGAVTLSLLTLADYGDAPIIIVADGAPTRLEHVSVTELTAEGGFRV